MGDRFKDPDNRQLRAFLERFDIVALSERMDEGLQPCAASPWGDQ